MNAFDRYFHAPFAASRAYLFSRVFLIVVALDTWMLMIGHAGRYGADGFNVAHFAWLDRLAPQPTAGLYVGVLLLTGLLALTLAISGPQRTALGLLFALYTWSWAMSMLDSYQHHYFVSSVLLCLVFFPPLRARDVHPPPPPPAANSVKPKQARARRGRPNPQPGAAEPTPTRYLISCALACVAFAAWPGSEYRVLVFVACSAVVGVASVLYARRRPNPPVSTSGFGFNLLGATITVLYAYTSIAKLDEQWLDGHTLTRISAATRVFAPLAEVASGFGIPADRFFGLLATSVVPVEMLIALCYACAVIADASASVWPRRIALLGFALAMSLHLGAELMELEIGWFSYYMILFACAYLLPAKLVDTLALAFSWPSQFVTRHLHDLFAPSSDAADSGRTTTLALGAGAAFTLAAVGKLLDLPGGVPACAIGAGALFALAAASSARGHAIAVRPALLGTGVAAALMWSTIAASDTRWDFYRYLGGDLSRRGEREAALEAYERGERHAPRDESRRDKIDALRRELGTPP